MSIGTTAVAGEAIADQRRGAMTATASPQPPRLLIAKPDATLTAQRG